MNQEITLSVKDLELWFDNDYGAVKILNKISFDIYKGETLGIVGESGCGKSMTSLCIMQLLDPARAHVMGSIQFQSRDLLKLNDRKMQQVRGKQISMIFQEPMTSLNPVYPIGDQLCETFVQHQGMTKKQAMGKALELMRLVRIPEPEQRLKEYPYQLSGGMRQRVMIAMALACRPELLIADEPTTALDVTIQAQILDLMQDELKLTYLFCSHDLSVIEHICDRVVIMYLGKIVEIGTREDIFKHPEHPYTKALLSAIPMVGKKKERILLNGDIPSPVNPPRQHWTPPSGSTAPPPPSSPCPTAGQPCPICRIERIRFLQNGQSTLTKSIPTDMIPAGIPVKNAKPLYGSYVMRLMLQSSIKQICRKCTSSAMRSPSGPESAPTKQFRGR